MVIECKLLRISHARREDFELASIRVHPKHGTPPGPERRLEDPSVRKLDVVAPIAHREIEFAVRTPDESVKIVPAERCLHAEAAILLFDDLLDPVAVFITKLIERRDRGHPERAFARFDPRDQARDHFVPFGQNDPLVGDSIAVLVFESHDAVGVSRKMVGLFEAALGQSLLVVGSPVLDRPRSEIIHQPIGMAAVVLSASTLPRRLDDIDAPLLIDVESDRHVLYEVVGEGRHLHPIGDLCLATDDGTDGSTKQRVSDHACELQEWNVGSDRQLRPDRDAEPDGKRRNQQAYAEPATDPM
jgi:hypothetical protein